MTARVDSLKWVFERLLETDRHLLHHSKKASLSDVSASQASGNVTLKIMFHFDDESCYSVTLKLAKAVEALFYENYSIQSDFPMARYYYHKKSMLFMQNLDGFAVKNEIHTSLNKQQVYAMAGHLADLHAYHLLSSADTSSWMPNDQSTSIDQFTKAAAQQALSATDTLSLCAYLKYCNRTIEKPVCVHGNFTSENILWQMDKDGLASNKAAAVVDWKDVQLGSPTDDLAQLLITCVDADERFVIQQSALELYYNTLRSHVSTSDALLECFTLNKLTQSFTTSLINQTIKFILRLHYICSSLDGKVSEGVASAGKAKLAMRAKFAVMEAVDYANSAVKERYCTY